MQLTLALLPGHAAASEHSISPPLTCPVMKSFSGLRRNSRAEAIFSGMWHVSANQNARQSHQLCCKCQCKRF